MTVDDLLLILKKYGKERNDSFLEFRLFDDGSGEICNSIEEKIVEFDDYKNFVLDKYGCKECNGTGIIEEDGLYTISDSLGSHTFFHTYPSKCPVCKGKGYIV